MPLFHSTPPPPPPKSPEPAPRASFLSSLRRTPASSTSGLSEYHSAVEPADDAQSVRSGFFFGRRRSAESLASHASATTTTTTRTTGSGHSRFSSNSRNASTPPTSPASPTSPSIKSGKSGNTLLTTTLLRRTPLPNPERDPTVRAARTKIAQAARAEEEADAAIKRAQESVREAMESVRVLEGEAGNE
ncbi:hypothetical protein MSAN_00339200 [Mycena sanguinolenta]|uniref:Uncharacterized protein n=1 Tax=Mycena sanguinolenta TaxID=230812 RepID=A0A8H7DKF9_9AGAR|nr:hypothetical protein MSAN_00339200 [Mycena sanguinolenta]